MVGTGGRDLVLPSSDKLLGELEEKQAVSSEEQCGIESCSADCPNPSAAGLSCAPSSMNGVYCLNFLSYFVTFFGLFIQFTSAITLLRNPPSCVS